MRVEEQNDSVDSLRKPLQHAREVVATVDSGKSKSEIECKNWMKIFNSNENLEFSQI